MERTRGNYLWERSLEVDVGGVDGETRYFHWRLMNFDFGDCGSFVFWVTGLTEALVLQLLEKICAELVLVLGLIESTSFTFATVCGGIMGCHRPAVSVTVPTEDLLIRPGFGEQVLFLIEFTCHPHYISRLINVVGLGLYFKYDVCCSFADLTSN